MIDIEEVRSIFSNDWRDNVFIVIVSHYDRCKDTINVEIWKDDKNNREQTKISLKDAIEYLKRESDKVQIKKNYEEYVKMGG